MTGHYGPKRAPAQRPKWSAVPVEVIERVECGGNVVEFIIEKLRGGVRFTVDIRQERYVGLIRTLNRRAHPVLLIRGPPYVVRGEELYLVDHRPEHRKLREVLAQSQRPWILIYDADDRTRDSYRGFAAFDSDLPYGVGEKDR